MSRRWLNVYLFVTCMTISGTPVFAMDFFHIGTSIIATGEINADDDIKFFRFVESIKVENLTEVRVAGSSGGATAPALKIGQWIQANGLNVAIHGECLSSCANYLFLAGRKKTLEKAIIGFHGSPTYTFSITPDLAKAYLESMTLDQVSWLGYKSVESARSDLKFTLDHEINFFNFTKVNQEIFKKTVNADERSKLGCKKDAGYLVPTISQMRSLRVTGIVGTIDTQKIKSDSYFCSSDLL